MPLALPTIAALPSSAGDVPGTPRRQDISQYDIRGPMCRYDGPVRNAHRADNSVPDDDDYRRLLELRTGLRQFLRWSEQQAEAVEVTPAQHQLLLAIRGHPRAGSPTIGDVAEALLLRHHSAVGLVDRAVAARLVVRHIDPVDHRLVRLGLTPLGARRLRQLSGAHLEELRRLAPRMRSLWANLEPVRGGPALDSEA
jgi:DNA-binding MarR family transcriptional regulator